MILPFIWTTVPVVGPSIFQRATVRLLALFLALAVCVSNLRAGEMTLANTKNPIVKEDVWHPWSVSLETAAAFGVNNFNDYQTLPQIFSVRYQRHAPEQFFSTPLTFGQEWAVSVAAVPFTNGLENHYFGVGLGPRLIFGLPNNSPFSIYVDGRFFVGWVDSTNKLDGQGQDLTFSAVSSLGILYQVNPKLKIGAAFFYEHFSNGGLSEPERENVGLDTVGPSLSLSYSF